MKGDLDGLQDFVTRNAGSVLHENHFLVLIAKRNYLFISRKRLVELLASCDREERQALAKMEFKAKEDLLADIAWVVKMLRCEEHF